MSTTGKTQFQWLSWKNWSSKMPKSFATWSPHILVGNSSSSRTPLKGTPNLEASPHALKVARPGPWGPACVPSPAAEGEGNGLKIGVLSLGLGLSMRVSAGCFRFGEQRLISSAGMERGRVPTVSPPPEEPRGGNPQLRLKPSLWGLELCSQTHLKLNHGTRHPNNPSTPSNPEDPEPELLKPLEPPARPRLPTPPCLADSFWGSSSRGAQVKG